MRTTLTLDDDVAILLQQLQEKKSASFKEAVNSALRAGLAEMSKSPAMRTPFHTRILEVGPCLLPNLDNISEVLAVIEGEDHK